MKYIYLTLLILGITLDGWCQEINLWESISKNFYRPGYWFTVRIKTPALFTGSRQTLVNNMGGITFNIQGKNTYTSYSYAYFLPDSSCPAFSIRLKNKNKNIVLYDDQLKLQKLNPQDHLIGIYKAKDIQKIIYNFLKQDKYKTYPEKINFLPSYQDSINIFNLIILGSKNLNPKYIKTIIKWIYSGGNVWVTKQKLFQSFQMALQEIPYKRTNNISILKAGFGNLIYTDFITRPELKNSICKKAFGLLSKNFKNKPQAKYGIQKNFGHNSHWNKTMKLNIWIISILYLLVYFFIIRLSFFYKYKKITYGIIILFITSAFVFYIFYMFYTKVPVNCLQMNIIELNKKNNFAYKKSYYYFSPIKKTNFKATISKLPILIDSLHEKKNIQITKVKNGWQLVHYNFSCHSYSIWYTKEYFPFNGVIKAERNQHDLIIKNYSPKNLSNCLYLQNGFFQKLKKIKAWKSSKELLTFKKSHIFDYKNLPYFWRKIKISKLLLSKKSHIAASIENNSNVYLKGDMTYISTKSVIFFPIKIDKHN